jgi:muconolactone D-isomerase
VSTPGACALEYNVVAWGRTELPLEAGIAVFVRATAARFAIARIYDDADPPLSQHSLELAPVRVNLICRRLARDSAFGLGCSAISSRRAGISSAPRCRSGALSNPPDVARLAIHLTANTAVTSRPYDIDRRAKARFLRQQSMEFLVEFEIDVPEGTPASEVEARESAEAAAAARLVDEGHLVRVWKRAVAPGETTTVLGLYRADSEAQLADLLGALPLYDWMQISVTALEPHPNDPAAARS